MLLPTADGVPSNVCVWLLASAYYVCLCVSLMPPPTTCVCVCAADLCEAGNSWLESEPVFRKAEQTEQKDSVDVQREALCGCSASNQTHQTEKESWQ